MARFTQAGGDGSGVPGPQGPAGADGADALWNFIGEYDNGADYYPGDLVTYNGGTYYRVGEPNPGYPPGTSYWTTIAEPGSSTDTFDKIYTTHNSDGTNVKIGDDAWIGDIDLANNIAIVGVQDDTQGGIVLGAEGIGKVYTTGLDLNVEANSDLFLNGGHDAYLTGDNDVYIQSNADDIHLGSNDDITFSTNVNGVAAHAWIMNSEGGLVFPDSTIQTTAYTGSGTGVNGEVTRWSPNFQATGLTFTGTDTTYPTYNSHYVKNGRMVSFWIAIDLATVTNFGTGQYKTELPFAPLTGTMNHFQAWANVDPAVNPDIAGHVVLQADHLANTSILDLHYLKQAGGANSPLMEAMLIQDEPATFTTSSKIYINGTYITAE